MLTRKDLIDLWVEEKMLAWKIAGRSELDCAEVAKLCEAKKMTADLRCDVAEKLCEAGENIDVDDEVDEICKERRRLLK